MTIRFTEEEKEWIFMDPFNWHVKEGCPKNIKMSLERKLRRLYNREERIDHRKKL